MSKLDNQPFRKPMVFKSPSQLTQAGKVSSFFPMQRRDDTGARQPTTESTSNPPLNRSKFSQYQKFMTSVKQRTDRHKMTILNIENVDLKPISANQIQLPPVQLLRDSVHNSSQEKSVYQYPQRNYFSPQNEFFLGKGKPIKVNPIVLKNDQSTSKSILHSTRVDRKVHITTARIQDFFSQANMKNELKSENNHTVKLRKSLTTFQQNKYQVPPSLEPQEPKMTDSKILRASSQYQSQTSAKNESRNEGKKSQSEEKIKVVDIFQEHQKRSNKEEQRLKTIVKNEFQPIERSFSKKLIQCRRQPPQEPEQGTVIHQESNYFSQEKSINQLLPSRQRIFSTKTPQKNGLIQQHFPQGQTKLNESKEILFNMQQQQRLQYRSNNTNDSTSVIKFSQLSNNRAQHVELEASNATNNFKLNIPESREPASQYFADSPLIATTDKRYGLKIHDNINQLNEYQINQKIYPKSSQEIEDSKAIGQQRADTVRTERILDLLLLSTCELKNYFNRESQDRGRKHPTQKVKFVQSKQQFPGDFFNILKS